MESYLTISFLNDFIFCPRSIYFHGLYGNTNKRLYQSDVQTKGLTAHQPIDAKNYSSKKSIYQSLDVYSQKYRIGGKIDTFDREKHQLTERKKKIKVIYDGYVFQCYAQYFCLTEMGYKVDSIRLYSLDDNKVYPILKPEEDDAMFKKFENLLLQMRQFSLNAPFKANVNKCRSCIYKNLCDASLC